MCCFITAHKAIVETELCYFISNSRFFISMLIWLICLPAGVFFMYSASENVHGWHNFWVCIFNSWFLLTLHMICDHCVCVFMGEMSGQQRWETQEGFTSACFQSCYLCLHFAASTFIFNADEISGVVLTNICVYLN